MSPTVTVVRDVVRYTDLSDDAREAIRMNNWRFQEWEQDQCQHLILAALDNHGVSFDVDVELSWCLSYCQGDGVAAAFDVTGDDVSDHEDWVDCWAGIPERTLGADLDPERLTLTARLSNRVGSYTSRIEATYECRCDCSNMTSHCGDWEDDGCCDPLCPNDADLEKIADKATDHLYAVCSRAYSDISSWCLEDRVEEIGELFAEEWFYTDGSICDVEDLD